MNLSKFEVRKFEGYITSVRSRVTALQYGRAVRQFLEWLAEDDVKSITEAPKDALANYCAMLAGQYSTATVRLQMAGVRRYLEWCRRGGLGVPNFHAPEIPKSQVKIRDALRGPALLQYFEAVKTLDEPIRTAALLLPCCGLRVSEMGSLQLDDIQPSTLRMGGVRKQILVLRVRGKGGRERSVPLLDEGRVYLTAYLRGWRRNRSDKRWLFPMSTSVAGHLVGRSLRAALQRVRQPLKMTFTPHTMRRTYLTELYRRGVEPVVLARIAGHANIDTLIRHYLALDDQDVVRAVHATGGTLMEART